MLRSVVNSTTFRSVGSDAERSVLEVEFVNGRVYQYANFPRELFEGLRVAPSVGRYYLDHIKECFEEIPLR
jgi:hypothetical protein